MIIITNNNDIDDNDINNDIDYGHDIIHDNDIDNRNLIKIHHDNDNIIYILKLIRCFKCKRRAKKSNG